MKTGFLNLLFGFILLTACSPLQAAEVTLTALPEATTASTPVTPTPIPTRPVYDPGTLVDYVVQTGDTLPALAAHFNSTVGEILEANPEISKDATTFEPGSILKIPIYYEALWGNPFQILPDSLYVDGPAQVGFDTRTFVDGSPGWLKNYSSLAGDETRRGGDLIDYVAQTFSISPRLLLAIAEYQTGALSQSILAPELVEYPFGYEDQFHRGFYLQLVWAANILNNGYYGWRSGSLNSTIRSDGTLENFDPWQNASTVALHYYFSQKLPIDAYNKAIYADGLIHTYTELFGDPWVDVQAHIPGGLEQPALEFPFARGKTWTFTGGPHAAWGDGEPLAALDFAPPSSIGGCAESAEFVTAVADGQIVRSDPAVAVLDLNGDGDERTGWVIFYLHLGINDKVRQGVVVKTGEPIGHPSCEGGSATGTHVHITRKYNGEWIAAGGALAFNLEGWVAANGAQPYLGTLKKYGRTVEACTCSDPASQITAGLFEK